MGRYTCIICECKVTSRGLGHMDHCPGADPKLWAEFEKGYKACEKAAAHSKPPSGVTLTWKLGWDSKSKNHPPPPYIV